MEKSKRGGYRPNAGRPKGSKSLVNLPKKAILEYTSPQELQNMVERAKKWAKTDRKMLQWYLEMVFGKPKAFEKDGGAKTVNNIAYFLDKLERLEQEEPLKPDYFIGDIPNGSITSGEFTNVTNGTVFTEDGQEIVRQNMETPSPVHN